MRLAALPLPFQARITYFTVSSHRLLVGSGMEALVDVTLIPKIGYSGKLK